MQSLLDPYTTRVPSKRTGTGRLPALLLNLAGCHLVSVGESGLSPRRTTKEVRNGNRD